MRLRKAGLYQDRQSLAQAAVAEVGVSEVTLDPGPPEVQARALDAELLLPGGWRDAWQPW